MGQILSERKDVTSGNKRFFMDRLGMADTITTFPSRLGTAATNIGSLNRFTSLSQWAYQAHTQSESYGAHFTHGLSTQQNIRNSSTVRYGITFGKNYFGVHHAVHDGSSTLDAFTFYNSDGAELLTLTHQEVFESSTNGVYAFYIEDDKAFFFSNDGADTKLVVAVWDLVTLTRQEYQFTTPENTPMSVYNYSVGGKFYIMARTGTTAIRIKTFDKNTNLFAEWGVAYSVASNQLTEYVLTIAPDGLSARFVGRNTATSVYFHLAMTTTANTYTSTGGTALVGSFAPSNTSNSGVFLVLKDIGLIAQGYYSSGFVHVSASIAPRITTISGLTSAIYNPEIVSEIGVKVYWSNGIYLLSGTTTITAEKTRTTVNNANIKPFIAYETGYYAHLAISDSGSTCYLSGITLYQTNDNGNRVHQSILSQSVRASVSGYANDLSYCVTTVPSCVITKNDVLLGGLIRGHSSSVNAPILHIKLPVVRLQAGKYVFEAIGGGAGFGETTPVNGTPTVILGFFTAGNGVTSSTSTTTGHKPGGVLVTNGSTKDAAASGFYEQDFGCGGVPESAGTCGGASGYYMSREVTLTKETPIIYRAGFGHKKGGVGAFVVTEV